MIPAKRILSIDVFRSVNMFFMIFVNDLSGVLHVPAWIDHVKANEDGMHFADAIFPIFLFIAGLSIPIAIGRRLAKGVSFGSIALHILLRSFALVVIGFFHVNMENYSDNALLPIGVWELLLTLSFFLIWLDYPPTLNVTRKYVLIGTGIAILIFLAIVFKGGTTEKPVGLRHYWWGILGIIGWAYFFCAGLFLIAKGKLPVLTGLFLLFILVNIAYHATFIDVDIELWVIKDCSSLCLMMAGVIISLLYTKITENNRYRWIWPAFTLIGIVFIAAGFLVRPYTEGISKINSTPAWVLICTGIGILIFELFIWLTDVINKSNWFKIIKPAGTSTLTCYLLPYLIFAIYQIADFSYPDFLNSGIWGIARSFAVAFAVIFIAGFLEKKGLRLKI
jgi:predicted acyltransferase